MNVSEQLENSSVCLDQCLPLCVIEKAGEVIWGQLDDKELKWTKYRYTRLYLKSELIHNSLNKWGRRDKFLMEKNSKNMQTLHSQEYVLLLPIP